MIINAEWLDTMSKQHQRKFQELLPELVKKLIINSCTSVSSIRMPHGDDIWAPGFDGVVDCSEGNRYVPAGRSVWEFGTNENKLQKINDDYQKRTQNPLGSKIEETSFCLVTPKVWAYPQTITAWEAEHTDWKQVKIYDASVLCDWIEQTPVVCAWLLEQFSDNHTAEFSTLAHAWDLFTQKTSPAMSDSLLLADREEEITCFFNKLGNEIVRVKAATRVEATGFVLAAMMQKPELREQCIVINTPNTYRDINQCVKSKMLILNYPCEHDINTENGNHVILCYGKEASSIRENVSLVELSKFHYICAFKDMGVSDPEELYTFTHGNLRALIRKIPGSSTESKPDWAEREDKDLLAPLLFMRNINRSSDIDRGIVEQLADASYDCVDKAYTEMMRKEDSPIKVVDGYYILVNYEETWDVLQYNVYSTQYDRLTDTILSIFDEVDRDSKFTAIFSTRVGRSNLLQNLLENYIYFSDSNDSSQKLGKTIRDFMAFVDKPNASNIIINHLSMLAQAAPRVIVDALNAEMNNPNGMIVSLFNHPQQSDNRYMNILFALDKLTFYSESAVPACRILFRLYQADQNKFRDSNSPYSSLLNALCFINTYSPLTIKQKVELLLGFLKKDSYYGGKLIIGILNKKAAFLPFKYGRIGEYPEKELFYAEYHHAIEQIAEACLHYFISGSDIESIITIFENYVNYRPQFLIDLAPLLEGNSFDAASLAKLNYTLRKTRYGILHHRLTRKKGYIPAFETWIRKTDDREIPFRWLFFDYRECPDDRLLSRNDDYYKRQQEMFSIRQDAFEKIFRKFGVEGVKMLLSQMDDNAAWGKFLANTLPDTCHTELANILLQVNRMRILAGLLDASAKETFYAVYDYIPADKRLQVYSAMSRMDVVEWLSTEEEKQAYCFGKQMHQYDENKYRTLLTYYPEGLLHYCAEIINTASNANTDLVMNVFCAIKTTWRADNILTSDEKCALSEILEVVTNSLYSDKWGKLCAELYLTNILTEISEPAERYFFEHPLEFIQSLNFCKETNDGKFWNLFSMYRLPTSAYTDLDALKHFSESLIAENQTDLLGNIYGRAIAGADGIFPHESIRELLEQFDSDGLDLQVYVAYSDDRGARFVLDGSDQMQKAAKFTADARALSISYPHTAAILRQIADDYRREGQSDRLYSEL